MEICEAKPGFLFRILNDVPFIFFQTCRKADANCPSNVQAAFAELENLFRSGTAGMPSHQCN